MPFSLTLRFVPEPLRSRLARLIRHLLVVTYVVTILIMEYLAEGIIAISLGTTRSLNGWIIFGLVGWLMLMVAVYSTWVYRLTREVGPSQAGSSE